MPKTIHTPRDELVCGKLDLLEDKLRELGAVECFYLTRDIRHDCERMEAKLVERKREAIERPSVPPPPKCCVCGAIEGVTWIGGSSPWKCQSLDCAAF